MVCRARRPIGSSASPRSALPPLPSPGRPPWSRSRTGAWRCGAAVPRCGCRWKTEAVRKRAAGPCGACSGTWKGGCGCSGSCRDAVTLSALAVAARSDLVPEWSAAPLVENSPANRGTTDETSRLTLSELRVPTLPAKTLDAARPAADQFINNLLSALEFNARVLALAEDPGSPLLARLRLLTIFSTNLDQFFMVDVGSLKHQVARGIVERSPDGLTPAEQLDAIAIRAPSAA